MPTHKEAHSNREALKKASRQERIPNLLLTRLERQQARRTPGPFWPVWLALLVGFVLLAFLLRKNFKNNVLSAAPAPAVAPTSVQASSTTVAAGDVVVPPVPPAAPVAGTPAPTTLVTAANTTPAPAPAPTAAPVPVPTITQWKGFYSTIKKYREVIVDNQDAWADLWKEMGQSGPAPAVNFQESMVVGIFLGDSAQGADVILSDPRDYRRHVTIPYRKLAASGGAPNATQPFHLKVVPKTDKAMRFLDTGAAPALPAGTTSQG